MRLLRHRKWLSVAVATTTMAGVLGAGGVAAASSSPVTIQYWTNDTNPVEAQIVSSFEKVNPDITVKLTQYQTDTYLSALATAASNRSLPDVFFEGLGDTLAHEYEDAGLIYNLTSYAHKNNWSKKFSALSIKLLTYKNQWWEEPLYDVGMGIWYRKGHLCETPHQRRRQHSRSSLPTSPTIKNAGYTPISLGGEDYWMPMRFFDGLLQYYGGGNGFYTAAR